MDVDEDKYQLDEYPDQDTLRILLLTDTHLGFEERDEARRYDSFRAFDEALSIGKQYNVDFVLHGGDLFDKNKPSRFAMVKATEILRRQCLGSKPVHFEVRSDQSRNFANGTVNYEDPNFNVAMPVFMIHGNHDDPAGLGNHAALELLSAANLINYFGRSDNLKQIQLFPILITKGETKLALYGLGHIRDERLHRLFLERKVQWVRPRNPDEWFSVFVIHQNRTQHSNAHKNVIPEEFLPSFLDIVFWGHEHECLIDLEESLRGNFFVTQPGASIATSLCQAEAKPKFVGIMEIRGEESRIVPIRLKTIRPFVFDDVILDDHFETNVEQIDILAFLSDRVKELIQRAEREYPRPAAADMHFDSLVTDATEIKDLSRLPLVRLRVEYTGFEKVSESQFAQQFMTLVANPQEILKFYRKAKRPAASGKKGKNDLGADLLNIQTGLDDIDQARPIKDLVQDILQSSQEPLKILPEPDFIEAVQTFVDKEERTAIEDWIDGYLSHIQSVLKDDGTVTEVDHIHQVASTSTERRRNQQQNEMAMQQIREEAKDLEEQKAPEEKPPKPSKRKRKPAVEMLVDEDVEAESLPKKKRARLPPSSQAIENALSQSQAVEPRDAPSRKRKVKKQVRQVVVEDSDSDIEMVEPPKKRNPRAMDVDDEDDLAPRPNVNSLSQNRLPKKKKKKAKARRGQW